MYGLPEKSSVRFTIRRVFLKSHSISTEGVQGWGTLNPEPLLNP